MAAGAEPEVVREYRHLLRTASADWQETAHRHALTALGPEVRADVLAQVRRLLLTGYRLRADDVHHVARLLVLAERRRPRTLLDGLPRGMLLTLAEAVTSSPTGRMLRVGIDLWDDTELVPFTYEPAVSHTGGGWSDTAFGTEVSSHDIGDAWVVPPPWRRP